MICGAAWQNSDYGASRYQPSWQNTVCMTSPCFDHDGTARNKRLLFEDMNCRHPWLALVGTERPVEPAARPAGAEGGKGSRIEQLLPILRCPEIGSVLELGDGSPHPDPRWAPHLACGGGPALLFPGMEIPKVMSESFEQRDSQSGRSR